MTLQVITNSMDSGDGSMFLSNLPSPQWSEDGRCWAVALGAGDVEAIVAAHHPTAAEIERAKENLRTTFTYIDISEHDDHELRLVATAALGGPLLQAEVDRADERACLGWNSNPSKRT